MFVERFLYALRSRGREAKFGKLCIVVGTVALFAFLLWGLIAAMGSMDWALENIERVLDLLGTPLGVGLGFAAAVFLILLGLAFLLFFAPTPPQSPKKSDNGATESRQAEIEQRSPEPSQEITQLREQVTQLEECERENEELKKELASRGNAGVLYGGALRHVDEHGNEYEDPLAKETRLRARIEQLEAENKRLKGISKD